MTAGQRMVSERILEEAGTSPENHHQTVLVQSGTAALPMKIIVPYSSMNTMKCDMRRIFSG